MGKTMDKKNVIMPEKSNAHLLLSMFSSLKSSADKEIYNRVLKANGDRIEGVNWSGASKLINDKLKDIKKLDPKETYWKIGLIGADLVFRVKSKGTGTFASLFPHTEEDVILVKGAKLAPVKMAVSEVEDGKYKFDSGTRIIIGQKEYPRDLLVYSELPSKGYPGKFQIEISGPGVNANLADDIKGIASEYEEELRAEGKKIFERLASDMEKAAGKPSEITKLNAQAQKDIVALLNEKVITAEFEKRVKERLAKNQNYKGHLREWQFKSAFSIITGTIATAAGVARAVASSGADITAYKSILQSVIKIGLTVRDIAKTEEAVAKSLDEAIAALTKQTESVLADCIKIYEKPYEGVTLPRETKFEAIKGFFTDAGSRIADLGGKAASIGDRVQGEIISKLKNLTGLSFDDYPVEKARKRYLVELGKLLVQLEKDFATLEKQSVALKNATLKDAVKLFGSVKAFGRACKQAKDGFRQRETYAENARAKIVALGIPTSNDTSLDKLQECASKLRKLSKQDIIDGGGAANGLVGPVIETGKQIKELLEQVIKAAA
ncbi:hypothetical protein [Radicibacter daui]|uniref:hypothetical protein n=1 Tax=Radicibacter daui TaxID=3064829 RepID=UPI004046E8C7